MKKVDLTGQRVGRLVVQKRIENLVRTDGKQRAQWVALCDCGGIWIGSTSQLISTTRPPTQSCGCIWNENVKGSRKTHQLSATRTYRAWCNMKDRCTGNKQGKSAYCKKAGITVCETWMRSFEVFFTDMGECPKGLSLDRINTLSNYEPGNCRWATRIQQMNNTTRNRRITLLGEIHTLGEWSTITNIPVKILSQRLIRGWGEERTLRTINSRTAVKW